MGGPKGQRSEAQGLLGSGRRLGRYHLTKDTIFDTKPQVLSLRCVSGQSTPGVERGSPEPGCHDSQPAKWGQVHATQTWLMSQAKAP